MQKALAQSEYGIDAGRLRLSPVIGRELAPEVLGRGAVATDWLPVAGRFAVDPGTHLEPNRFKARSAPVFESTILPLVAGARMTKSDACVLTWNEMKYSPMLSNSGKEYLRLMAAAWGTFKRLRERSDTHR